MQFPRKSGILLPVTSLPSAFGIGDFGQAALDFIDFLKNSGQKIWQILPIGPPALGNSPYSCYSAFAGSPLLICLEQLAQDGWIENAAPATLSAADFDDHKVDYDAVTKFKQPLLRQAFTHSQSKLSSNDAFGTFCNENDFWLKDFSRFEALRLHFDQFDWTQWPHELVHRDEAALATWDEKLKDEIEYSKFLQFVFDQQWRRVLEYAHANDVEVFGDMPIFVATESADVWSNQEIFRLDDQGKPTVVAGVPPDYFSETGQLWGNPLYRWDKLESTNYAWWVARISHAFRQFDLLRIDHFRGFESYWEVPAAAETAAEGKWVKGPGARPFEAVKQALGDLPIIAEDLGMITQQVHDLREQLNFPAMRVIQFGYDTKDDDFHRPSSYPEQTVAYTGTHDNDTLMGWYANYKSRHPDGGVLGDHLDSSQEIHFQLIQQVLDSASHTAIIPLQDYLGMDSTARINRPGQATGNWDWRISQADFTKQLAEQIDKMTKQSNR